MSVPSGYAFQPEWNAIELQEREARNAEGEVVPDEQPAVAAMPARARLGNTDWCECGQCVAMATEEECVCCREYKRCRELQQQDGCIVNCDAFHSVCMKRVVLEVFHVARKMIRGGRPRVRGRAPEELNNK